MEELSIVEVNDSEETEELSEANKQLINSIVRSGQTHLKELWIDENIKWWSDSEATLHLCNFI